MTHSTSPRRSLDQRPWVSPISTSERIQQYSKTNKSKLWFLYARAPDLARAMDLGMHLWGGRVVCTLVYVTLCVTTEPLYSKALQKNLKLGRLKGTCKWHNPERNRMRITANCILTHSAVFWSVPSAVTTVTAMHDPFTPAETRTWRMCTCLYSCMYSCVVTAHR